MFQKNLWTPIFLRPGGKFSFLILVLQQCKNVPFLVKLAENGKFGPRKGDEETWTLVATESFSQVKKRKKNILKKIEHHYFSTLESKVQEQKNVCIFPYPAEQKAEQKC